MRQNGRHLRPTPVKLVPTKWLLQRPAAPGRESPPHKGGCRLPAVRQGCACLRTGCQLEGCLGSGVRGAEETQRKAGRRRRTSWQGMDGKAERLWRYVLACVSGQRSLWRESLSVGYQGSRKFNSDWHWCSIYFRRSIFWLFFPLFPFFFFFHAHPLTLETCILKAFSNPQSIALMCIRPFSGEVIALPEWIWVVPVALVLVSSNPNWIVQLFPTEIKR